MALKFCANLNFLFTENGVGFLEKYFLAKKAGFRGVETGFPTNIQIDKIQSALNETGLEQVLLNICTDGPDEMQFGCCSFPGAEQQFQNNLIKTIEMAKALNCKKIHVMAGKCNVLPTAEHDKSYLMNLKFAASLFENEKLIGLIEPINKYAVADYYLNNFKKAIEVIDSVNSPNLKLMMDIFHLQHIQGNVSNTCKELIDYIGHIQIAQVPNRHEPNFPGELNFNYLFKEIEKAGYTGWVGCEYKPSKATADCLDWVEEFGYSL